MTRSIQQGLLADGIMVPLIKRCARFGVPRRTVYCKPTKAAPKIDPRFANPIEEMIESEPSFGYRTVARLLGFNKTTLAHSMPSGGGIHSISSDLCRVWSSPDGWTTLALVIDCLNRCAFPLT